MPPQTLVVLGASKDRTKYSNKAVRAYSGLGWTVYPVNPNESEIEGLKCYRSILDVPQPIDRVTVYLPPSFGVKVLADVARAKPGEVFFNPGSDSPDLIERASALGLNAVVACSITNIGMFPSQIGSQ